ncbi:hypothetical protein ILUMI_08365 [Ignelater luminosus]|uniref:Coilin tudor domain-containing protein n=1 Tax=Ignelater luminosus TaxID=2038154 RepID=A0A8K0GFH0_IGNLU|nr:hypothetical protein ILUMI_08365 [Ignelater luminosus]
MTMSVLKMLNLFKRKKKKNKEKGEKSLSNDKEDIRNLSNEDNGKKAKIIVCDSFNNNVKVGNTRSSFNENNNNNNVSKTIPTATALKFSKPKKLELMKISSIPKIIKTIHVFDREPIASNKIVDELSKCKECENEAMIPTAGNTVVGSKAAKLIDNDHLIECPEKVNVSNSFVTLKSCMDNSSNNSGVTTANSTDDKKANGFTEDEKCENMDKLIIPSLDLDREKSVNDTEVSLSNNEKYEHKSQSLSPERTNDAEVISTKNNEDQLKEITEDKKVHVLENVCVQPAVIDKDSTRNSVISAEEFSESVASITTDETNLELPKPKRKRKRTRRKKIKEPVENGISETPFPVFAKPNNIPTPSNKHIKFEDDNEDEILKNQQAQQFQSNADNSVNDQNNQHDVIENASNIVQVIENVCSPFSYEKLCKEEIMKYPVMVDIYPKVGDIIAFKIYVLSEHYTPEISNFIIAKVVNYNTGNKIVFLRFLAGGEQCTEPEGKFYMEAELAQPKNGERYFSWEALKEPRLLFP